MKKSAFNFKIIGIATLGMIVGGFSVYSLSSNETIKTDLLLDGDGLWEQVSQSLTNL